MQLRFNTTSFRQEEREQAALACERMKESVKIYPSHGTEEWLILHLFYNALAQYLNVRLTLLQEEHSWESKLMLPQDSWMT
jgi:hypothetical protein